MEEKKQGDCGCGPAPVKRVLCAASSGHSAPMTWTSLPVEALQRAPKRVAWVGVLVTIVTVVMFLLQARLQPEIAAAQMQPPVRIAETAMVVCSLLLAAAFRFGWCGPLAMVRLGLVFQVLVSFSLALFEHSMPWPADQPVRGMSTLVTWIVASSLFLPAPPLAALWAAMASAAMGPLAHYASLYWLNGSPLAPNRMSILFIPPFLVAFCSWFMARIIYKLETSAQKVKDLGSYDLEEMLGRGGMGEVWRARHKLLKREAAVKLIRNEVLVAQTGKQAEVLRKRFEQEARATAALSSPHTVSLFDFGVDEAGSFFYAMELLNGMDLEELVKRFGPQPAARVAHILVQACRSLEEAHCKGMVHRDIKPTNLFLCRLGSEYDYCKLLDFGLAKWRVSSEAMKMTLESVTTGTPAYMAPELAMGSTELDGRTDLYGLGCVAYWLLTGKLVFDESNPTAMALAHVQKAPPEVRTASEMKVSAGLSDAIGMCLAKKPAERPVGARALRLMIEACDEYGEWKADEAERWWQVHAPEVAVTPCLAEQAAVAASR